MRIASTESASATSNNFNSLVFSPLSSVCSCGSSTGLCNVPDNDEYEHLHYYYPFDSDKFRRRLQDDDAEDADEGGSADDEDDTDNNTAEDILRRARTETISGVDSASVLLEGLYSLGNASGHNNNHGFGNLDDDEDDDDDRNRGELRAEDLLKEEPDLDDAASSVFERFSLRASSSASSDPFEAISTGAEDLLRTTEADDLSSLLSERPPSPSSRRHRGSHLQHRHSNNNNIHGQEPVLSEEEEEQDNAEALVRTTNISLSDFANRTMQCTKSSDDSSIVDRLSDFEDRGWISRKEYLSYRKLLLKQPSSTYYRKQIARELDDIAVRNRSQKQADADTKGNTRTRHTTTQRYNKYDAVASAPAAGAASRNRYDTSSSVSGASSSAAGGTAATGGGDENDSLLSHPTSILGGGGRKDDSGKSRTAKRHVSWEDQSRTSDQTFNTAVDSVEDKENDNLPCPLIIKPADLWTGMGRLTEQQIQELFVEMCFFARLGFVQPPCCLQCTYRESMNKKAARFCQRWVVWRKDASTVLHPNKLDGNILIVQCHVARSLMNGNSVEGFKWDITKKQVVSSSTVSSSSASSSTVTPSTRRLM